MRAENGLKRIYLHPTLFIGGEVGEAYWDVPWRHGRHPHSDPEMLRLQTNHAAELARRYQNEDAILAWDLTAAAIVEWKE